MDGQIRCKTGFECKVPGGMGGVPGMGGMAGGMMAGMAGMGAGMGMGGMAGFGQQVTNTTSAPAGSCLPCFIHGKSRKVEFLEDYSEGLYKCKEGFECKGGGGPAGGMSSGITYMCSAHGKMRSAEALDEIVGADGNIAHQCKATHTCKTTGAPYNSTPRMPGMGGKGGSLTSLGQAPMGVPGTMWEQSVQQAAAALLGFPTGTLGGGGALGGYDGLAQLVGYSGMPTGAATAPATPRGGGGAAEGTARCRVHGKNRTLRNLQADPAAPGEYMCIASSACQ